MSQQFLSINRGQFKPGDVATATSAPSADVYVQILSTNSPTRKDTILALMLIIQFLESDGIQSGSRGTNIPIL